jgi:peptidoglycan glycosyltransferase
MKSRLDTRVQILGIFLLIMYGIVFVQLNNIQVKRSASLVNSPYNIANFQPQDTLPRGAVISSDGYVLAYSKNVNDKFKELRVYPFGSLFSGIVGYDSLYYSTSGVEYVYNKYLVTHESSGSSLNGVLTSSDSTDDVILTTSYQYQYAAYQAIVDHLGKTGVGAVVALDPRNGNVLAMYAQPNYDPNLLSSHNIKSEIAYRNSLNPKSPTTPLLNGAYSQIYSPGSTFKIVTTSTAFDHPPTPNFATTYYAPDVSSISLPDSNLLLHNYANEVCGGNIPVLLEVSCDTGYGEMGLRLGYNAVSQEADSFGFNQVPPLDETGVAASRFPQSCSVLPYIAYCSIGQYDVSASALQMAMVAGAIANNGVMMTPHVMAKIENAEGNVVQTYVPTPWKFATSYNTAQNVRSDMILVAEHGTAAGLFSGSTVIAAKTGTAQTNPGAGSNDWLVAFGPAGAGQTPTVAVAAVVPWEPGLPADTTGAEIAGPIVAQLLSYILANPSYGD